VTRTTHLGVEQKKSALFRKLVSMTDRMQHIRLDLQKRVDETMEESKGYKAEDMQLASLPGGNSVGSSSIGNYSEKGHLKAIFNAIDKESMREDKRLNKIANDAKKQLLSSPSSNFDASSLKSMGSSIPKSESTKVNKTGQRI